MKTGELSSNDKETLENSEAIQTESEQENPEKQNKWQEAYIDYLNIDTEFFSSDHLYYMDDGYKGFSDYSVV